MSLLPFGMLLVEFAHFEDGGVEVALITVGVSQVVAYGSILRSEPFRITIFDDGFIKLILFVKDQGQVGMSLPERGVETDCPPISVHGAGEIPGGVQSDAQIVISVWIVDIAGE